MVAETCKCPLYATVSRDEQKKKTKTLTLLTRLNDSAIVLLEQIFLECQDSFSDVRFGVLLSNIYRPVQHKFAFGGERIVGISGTEYSVDIGIYVRDTENNPLVAVGIQNNNESQNPTDDKSVNNFLAVVKDLRSAHSNLRGAYYSSSYGYKMENKLGDIVQRWHENNNYTDPKERLDVRFFDYKDKIYHEIKFS